MLLYLGSLFLWLSHFDGGFCAYWFARAWAWMRGTRLLLSIGVNPSFHIFKLDMDCHRLSTKDFQVKCPPLISPSLHLFSTIPAKFQANCDWLKFGGHALIDLMNDGSAVMSELTHECNVMRITQFPPPFVPQTLRQQALNK